MSDAQTIDRFEELEAGRVLGDLSPEEWEEWNELSKTIGKSHDASLELVAAAIEADIASQVEEPLPTDLEDLIRRDIGDFVVEEPADNVVHAGFPTKSLLHPAVAWSIAAALAFLLVAVSLTKGPTPKDPSLAKAPTVEQSLAALRESDSDIVSSPFSGLDTYKSMNGEVVWSNARQEGYMVLTDLPANDPTARQYQLWIVDPTRDEAPVDGGVFDIPTGPSTAIIPIDAKLAVQDPRAFVITLEQPGGVVKSKQEVVVALAKVS